ncbi:hypothetical protein [Dielma fastidiosa]|uniref:Uncharacterized protein n=1 Tax=Dielma fastidiosa TaxID=1034346 RepID=A0A318KPI8_9FIRM|nr:hypothetical protein [Dielma fastidiosa]PXX79721.1 hypothetical protein DES51_105195 [Dielma fastidiosa]
MLEKLDGYDVTAAELDKFIAGLTVPAFDVEVIKIENIYEVYCNGTLLYFSELEIFVNEERQRLEDNWLIEQAQIHFADKKIVPASGPEPLPELTDRELLNETHELILESNINSEYIASLIELGI